MTLLLRVTLAYSLGLLVGLRQPPALWVAIALCVAAGAALCMRRRAASLAALFMAGIAVGGLRATEVARDCREQLRDGARISITGVPLVVPTEGAAVPVRVHTLHAGATRCADIVIRMRVPQRHAATLDSAVRRHVAITVHGRWTAYSRRNGWPRAPEFAGAMLADVIMHAPDAPSADMVTRLRTSQQQNLRALLPERWGLAESLLLAERAGISSDVRIRWISSGLVHLLAISGMHVALIAGGVLFICTLLGVPPRTGRRIALAASTAYVLFLGAPSAALRSLFQATLLLASSELQRPAEPFTALAAAALGIFLLEPMALLEVGFQLSFAGMIGLVAWRRPIMSLLPDRLHPWLRDGLATGIAATALTTPVAALHFGTASWIGIPATLVAAPLLALALALLVLALLIAALTGVVTGVHAWAVDSTLALLDRIAAAAAAVPGGHGYLSTSTVAYALLAAAGALLLHAHLRRGAEHAPPSHAPGALHERHLRRHVRRRLRIGIALAACLALLAWAPLLLRTSDGFVEIHAIDVGQGDAFAIRTPAGRWLLVDAGPRTARGDAGRDRVVPYLLQRGARRIEALILTHPDADHIGGAAAVLEAFDVGLVIDPGLVAGKDMFIDLLAAARQSGQRWIAGRAGISFAIDGVGVDVMYPPGDVDPVSNANDNSVVFRLTFGTFAALFLGDAPMSVEDRLVALHGEGLGAAVLKVGHHGSATSTGEALLRAAHPRLALVSAGRRNRYGHPNPGVLRRLASHEVRVLRTDVSGNFIVRAARSGSIEVLAR